MSPPTLTFTRELRVSSDVVIRVTPRATGVEKVHAEGHIFLMSDLFLVCERMTPEELGQRGKDADMWLCYPPLSGKVLRVSEVEGNGTILTPCAWPVSHLASRQCFAGRHHAKGVFVLGNSISRTTEHSHQSLQGLHRFCRILSVPLLDCNFSCT